MTPDHDNWAPWDDEPRYPELVELPNEIPGQRDIFGGEVHPEGAA